MPRTAKLNRETGETKIAIELNIDGAGKYRIDTGNGMFDHLLSAFSRHGLFDLEITARGDTHVGWHHLVEDTGILLGRAIKQAVGDARGITRMAHAYAPLDETLAFVAVDFGGRGYAVIDAEIGDSDLGGLAGSLINHYLESMAREGAFNLHVRIESGANNHHKAEATFKALARATRAALSLDERLGGQVPSTKGTIG
ncbi:MAG: imidazoleglycerol-phosphate dehydratase HisB [SAR202 cluster bacterium]|nr:imidazoleglycerol-phosphate dehydratase HisB [SAR202 cluster bacterium]